MASEIKVNKISPASGTAFQIGDSGDTTTLPSGSTVTAAGTINVTGTINNTGTATGFGSIDWQTSDIKTSTFTGVAAKGYFVNSGSGSITANLPASPSAGDQMAVADYGNNANTNNITVGRNSSNIEGSASDFIIREDGAAVNFIYVDATKGWIAISTADADASKSDYVIASGGTESTSGNEKIHIFESSGTFTVTNAGNANGSNTVDYLVIGGGASGGWSDGAEKGGGGGGAGGFRTNYGPGSPTLPGTDGLSVSAQAYPITVGAGGAGAAPGASNGANSIFSSITSTGGGHGGFGTSGSGGSPHAGQPGGSGGGSTKGGSAGSGNTPPVSPPQGNNGGSSAEPGGESGSGGGGAGGVGASVPGSNGPGGAGGAGTPSIINGVNADRGGGGGGGGYSNPGGSGGGGGGGSGGSFGGSAAENGESNKGGGGGGARSHPGSTSGANGGSGYVVIRYKYQN